MRGPVNYWEWRCAELDPERFTAAWIQVVRRHDALRTVIQADGTRQVRPWEPAMRVPILDLRGRSPRTARRRLAAVREQSRDPGSLGPDHYPIDMRITLPPDGHVRIHLWSDAFIVDEGGVLHVLLPELVNRYEGRRGTPNGPSATPSPAPDAGLTSWAGFGVAARQSHPADRTGDRPAGTPPGPDLPMVTGSVDGPNRTSLSRSIRRRTLLLPPRSWAQIVSRAAELQVTPTAVAVAALAAVLGRWSTTETFTLDMILVAPHDPCDDAAVGPPVVPALLVVDGAATSFTDRVRALQRALAALQQAGTDGSRPDNRCGDDKARLVASPRTLIVSHLGGCADHGLPSSWVLERTSIDAPQTALTCRFSAESSGALRVDFFSPEGLFPPLVAEAMLDALRLLLRLLAGTPTAWTREHLDLVPLEQHARRAQVNSTDVAVPSGLLHEALAEHARTRPDATAVVTPTRQLTFRELSGRVNQVGRFLREAGVRPNQLVAIVMEKGWEQIVAVHGVLVAGGAYLPIDPTIPPARLHKLLAYGEVGIVLTQSRLDESLHWPPAVRRLAVDRDFESLDDSPIQAVQQQTDLAYVIFTSGSTGTPKGVMVDHRGAVNTITDINQRFGIGPDDRCLAVSGLHFDLSVYDCFGVTAVGGAVVVPASLPTPDPRHWAELMDQTGVTFWNSVPALMEMLVLYLEITARRRHVQRLRLVILAGDWIPVTLPDRIRTLNPQTRVIASGGPAETCIWSVINPLGVVDPGWTSIPYGKPMNNQRYHVLDRHLQPCPDWVPGEIYIASEVGLAMGYWRDEERTVRQFLTLPDGSRAYASGDRGRYLPDGSIEILGRADFQVKIQGVRIELGEIEAALAAHPDVRSAVVVASGRGRSVPMLHAYVIWARQEPAGGTEILREALAEQLPAVMVPPLVTALDRFPYTGNGKIDRRALSEGRLPAA